MTQPSILAIVIPCYNEEACLPETISRLTAFLAKLKAESIVAAASFLMFVDDGSTDLTWSIIKERSAADRDVHGIKLTRNYGHQYALLAGLRKVTDQADCCISIDADLQQDINAIHEFLDKYYQGNDIVFGIRNDRKADRFLKRGSSGLFYSLMAAMGINTIKNHADYRLLSKKVLISLKEYTETNLFLRGLFPTMGFKTAVVYHDVHDRLAGKSKYNMRKMFSLALSGITSFSITPIRFVTVLGVIAFLFSLLMGLYVLITYFFNYDTVITGWASTILPIYFIGGVQLISLGIVGEYVGKIYMEVKRRPTYLIEEEC
jgi:glycosyltransferase involved in cell wall biosynthesis